MKVYIINSIYMVSRLGKSTGKQKVDQWLPVVEKEVTGNRRLFEGGWKTMDLYPSSTWFCTSTGAEDGEAVLISEGGLALSGVTSGVSTHSSWPLLKVTRNTSYFSHSLCSLPSAYCALTCCLHKTEHPQGLFSIRRPRLSYRHGPQWSRSGH